MQLSLADLPDFPPRHRIGIKQRGLILRPDGERAGHCGAVGQHSTSASRGSSMSVMPLRRRGRHRDGRARIEGGYFMDA